MAVKTTITTIPTLDYGTLSGQGTSSYERGGEKEIGQTKEKIALLIELLA
jgi:hypothetical protein